MADHKIAATFEEAYKIETTQYDKPRGWIQWKGTDVCMDLHCKCGAHCHIDAWFVYGWRCPHCKTVYMCNAHVEMIEVTNEPHPENQCIQEPERDEDTEDSDMETEQ